MASLLRTITRHAFSAVFFRGNCKTGCSKGVSPLISTLDKAVDGLATPSFAGWLCVSSGGTANSTTVNSGRMYVSSGSTANLASVTLKDGDKATDSILISALDDNIRYIKLEAASTGVVTYHIS